MMDISRTRIWSSCLLLGVLLHICYVPGNATPVSYNACSEEPCPVDGKWGNWSEVYCSDPECETTSQLVMYSRECDNPAPAGGGAECTGPALHTVWVGECDVCKQAEIAANLAGN
ncbi:properdin-like isoform X1 [Diadema antillarum]|uniref:properdin-like isoform X1 n=1 Tax=Diadema antillarum TaxID=105358 RepID=UPI003A898A74